MEILRSVRFHSSQILALIKIHSAGFACSIRTPSPKLEQPREQHKNAIFAPRLLTFAVRRKVRERRSVGRLLLSDIHRCPRRPRPKPRSEVSCFPQYAKRSNFSHDFITAREFWHVPCYEHSDWLKYDFSVEGESFMFVDGRAWKESIHRQNATATDSSFGQMIAYVTVKLAIYGNAISLNLALSVTRRDSRPFRMHTYSVTHFSNACLCLRRSF